MGIINVCNRQSIDKELLHSGRCIFAKEAMVGRCSALFRLGGVNDSGSLCEGRKKVRDVKVEGVKMIVVSLSSQP